jgi:hypothetical protein
MRLRILFGLLFLLPFTLMAQEKRKEPSRGLALGVFAHTNGFGLDVQYHLYRTNRMDIITGVTFASMRHPRQLKIESAYADQGGKRYFFDKKNYGFVLAPTMGLSKVVIGQDAYSLVSVRTTLSGGPVLGLLKPYYLEVAIPFSGNQAYVEVDKYDATKYNYSNIVGEADYLLGIGEMSVVPGLQAKFAAMLNFAGKNDLIRAIEMNVYATWFTSKLDLMDLTEDKNLYVGGGISFLFGDKW